MSIVPENFLPIKKSLSGHLIAFLYHALLNTWVGIKPEDDKREYQ